MKITKTLYIGWEVNPHSKAGGEYSVKDYNPTWNKDFTIHLKQDFEFEVHEVDARGEIIVSLKREKQSIIKMATGEAQQIEERIQQLLALPQWSGS